MICIFLWEHKPVERVQNQATTDSRLIFSFSEFGSMLHIPGADLPLA